MKPHRIQAATDHAHFSIVTKKLIATNRKGARIKCTFSREPTITKVYSYNDGTSSGEAKHRECAQLFLKEEIARRFGSGAVAPVALICAELPGTELQYVYTIIQLHEQE